MPSTKPTILCTGPVDETVLKSAEYQDVTIDVIPFTAISTDIPGAIQQQIKDTLTQHRTVVFTSSNAVRAVGELMKKQPKDWTIFCIGNTTYSLAKKYFGAENIKDTASTAAALAKKILPNTEITGITFFCGNLRRSELPDALVKNGVKVTEIIVYETSLVPVSLEKKYDAVIFFSPSAAESFFSKNTVPQNTTLFVMGKTTADSIKKYSGNQIITGNEPDKNALIKEAVDFVHSRRAELNKG